MFKVRQVKSPGEWLSIELKGDEQEINDDEDTLKVDGEGLRGDENALNVDGEASMGNREALKGD